jgi:hypothetical protein
MRACLILLVACGPAATSTLANRGATGPTPDLGIVLAPQNGTLKVFEAYRTKATKAGEPLGGEGPPPMNTAYDFDRDGVDDLTSTGQVMYGPSQGWVVELRDGTKLAEAFAMSGEWADASEIGDEIAIRFQSYTLAPGEARYSVLVRYDRKARAFRPLVKAYVASQTTVPVVRGPFATFHTSGAATLRATPAIDDTPAPSSDESEDSWNRTTTLRGNVVATYQANARGLVLAADGEWRYVAFDFATRPEQTSLGHGQDVTGGHEPNKLTSDAWLCGWIRASEIQSP